MLKKYLPGGIFVVLVLSIYYAVKLHGESVRITAEDVSEQARRLAQEPYSAGTRLVSGALAGMKYDQAREIRFQKSRALWADEGLPFRVEFFMAGWVNRNIVQIFSTDTRETREFAFSPALFDFGRSGITPQQAADGGFSGFRVHYELNRPEVFDELIVYQGATYFRALGRGHIYGLSARGLAVDCGLEGVSEEFPVFERFWIERPLVNSENLVIHALMNSPSVTGAYTFDVRPGEDTQVHVRARIFFRKSIRLLGVAPLTSMFWFGENSQRVDGDFRPEVHDSDGLLVANGDGEWLWTPLENPQRLRSRDFVCQHPRGFGLLQRDRDFRSYQDLEALYHRRPSAWVEPVGDWGQGKVRLVEIPTRNEFEDNIVAFWVPEKNFTAGDELELEYVLHWTSREARLSPGGFCSMTRLGRVPGEPLERKVILNFAGDRLRELSEEEPVEALFSVSEGASIYHQNAQKIEETGEWRAVARIRFDGTGKAVTLRAFLRLGNDILTETWTQTLDP